ncbi:hypothetical protein ACFY8S_09310 [Streptomyces hygroscopicus]|uniref:hypothetical protein n=1 Tax=Streptomyces hygroscopicus TaxID=1912 RepID=UPI0036CE9174
MTPTERRALLGDDVIDHIHRVVEEAIAEAPPTPEVLDTLRRILTRPTGRLPAAEASQVA